MGPDRGRIYITGIYFLKFLLKDFSKLSVCFFPYFDAFFGEMVEVLYNARCGS